MVILLQPGWRRPSLVKELGNHGKPYDQVAGAASGAGPAIIIGFLLKLTSSIRSLL